MRNYAVQKEIEKIFLENGFTENEFVVGTGQTFSKKDKKCRFEFRAGNRKPILNRTAQYVVKYFAEQDFCILWEPRRKTSEKREVYRSCYSIDVADAQSGFQLNKDTYKGVEFHWRLQENVTVVDIDGLKQIVKKLSQERR
jgi:hypothetical protein